MGEWKERGLAMWERFDKRQHYIMLGSALAILVLIFGLSFWYGSKPDMVPLFTDMETKDAGEVSDISQVVVAGQKAEIALQLTLQLRNRAVSAYQEIMRMQV